MKVVSISNHSVFLSDCCGQSTVRGGGGASASKTTSALQLPAFVTWLRNRAFRIIPGKEGRRLGKRNKINLIERKTRWRQSKFEKVANDGTAWKENKKNFWASRMRSAYQSSCDRNQNRDTDKRGKKEKVNAENKQWSAAAASAAPNEWIY